MSASSDEIMQDMFDSLFATESKDESEEQVILTKVMDDDRAFDEAVADRAHLYHSIQGVLPESGIASVVIMEKLLAHSIKSNWSKNSVELAAQLLQDHAEAGALTKASIAKGLEAPSSKVGVLKALNVAIIAAAEEYALATNDGSSTVDVIKELQRQWRER
jgi:hypothetical protein